MAITIVGTQDGPGRVSNQITVAPPAGLQAGDYLFFVVWSGNNGLSNRATPTGFTELEWRGIASPPYVVCTYGKIAGASEADVVFSCGGTPNLQAFTVAFRGVDQTSPVAGTNNDVRNLSDEDHMPISTPVAVKDGSKVVQFCSCFNKSEAESPIIFSNARGWTLQHQKGGPASYPEVTGAWAERNIDVSSGSLNSPSWNGNGDTSTRWSWNTIVLSPGDGAPAAGTATIDGKVHTISKGDGTPLTVATGDGTGLG